MNLYQQNTGTLSRTAFCHTTRDRLPRYRSFCRHWVRMRCRQPYTTSPAAGMFVTHFGCCQYFYHVIYSNFVDVSVFGKHSCRYPSLFHLMFHGSAWMRVWDVFLYTIYESTHANTSFDSKHDHTRPSEEQDKIEKEMHKLFARVAVALIKAHPRFLMTCEKMMSDTRPCDLDKFMKIFCPWW